MKKIKKIISFKLDFILFLSFFKKMKNKINGDIIVAVCSRMPTEVFSNQKGIQLKFLKYSSAEIKFFAEELKYPLFTNSSLFFEFKEFWSNHETSKQVISDGKMKHPV